MTTSALILDNIYSGYELAILCEPMELKTFCENEIGENATEVLRSSNFFKCKPNLSRHILQLDSLQCDECAVFGGCMAWAKAACVRNQCDGNDAQNIRSQLGDLFYEIRFGELTHEELQHRYRTLNGLFSAEEFRDITMMITSKEFRAEMFNRCPR